MGLMDLHRRKGLLPHAGPPSCLSIAVPSTQGFNQTLQRRSLAARDSALSKGPDRALLHAAAASHQVAIRPPSRLSIAAHSTQGFNQTLQRRSLVLRDSALSKGPDRALLHAVAASYQVAIRPPSRLSIAAHSTQGAAMLGRGSPTFTRGP